MAYLCMHLKFYDLSWGFTVYTYAKLLYYKTKRTTISRKYLSARNQLSYWLRNMPGHKLRNWSHCLESNRKTVFLLSDSKRKYSVYNAVLLVKSAWIWTFQRKVILLFSIGSKAARDKIGQIAHVQKARRSFSINKRGGYNQGHPMDLFLKISVLQAFFCWLGDVKEIIVLGRKVLLGKR